EAREMDWAGKSLDEILVKLASIREKMELIFTVDTMKYAKLSGRIRSLQATLASILDIKPIIELQDGALEIKEKVRSRKASLEKLIDRMKQKVGDQSVQIAVIHAHDPVTGQMVIEEVKKTFNCAEVGFAEISISLAAHFGPGTIGLAAYPE
ncbi:MAG: DegV family protein, partial [Anaerolineaceae bacterium]